MVEIPLTQGKVALVDDVDAPRVQRYRWHVAVRSAGRNTYAATKVPGEGRHIYMHRLILPGAPQVDHVDGNGLNNRRGNLRSVTTSQNKANGRAHHDALSRYKGVTPARKGWVAVITKNYRLRYLGWFRSEEEAARAYNLAAGMLFGRYARLNIVPPP